MNRFHILFFLFVFTACAPGAQTQHSAPARWNVVSIPLPGDMADPEKQFSGLSVYNNILYLMPECRIQENHETILYATPLNDISHYLQDHAYQPVFKKYTITGLQQLATAMFHSGSRYEGLESIVVHGDDIYFGVETSTLSPEFFLLKGSIQNDRVVLDTNTLTGIAKPVDKNGFYIYNSGPEALTMYNDHIYCFYEYNYFDTNNVYTFDTALRPQSKQLAAIDRIPFRITDICMTGAHDATAINFFYKGGGNDTIYRPQPSDINYKLVHDDNGFKSYQRLIHIHFGKDKITYEPIGDLPETYQAYNWEGIAVFNKGYLLINDKYTPAKPYKTELILLQPE